jgi:predicted PurR-regulated permease PerM
MPSGARAALSPRLSVAGGAQRCRQARVGLRPCLWDEQVTRAAEAREITRKQYNTRVNPSQAEELKESEAAFQNMPATRHARPGTGCGERAGEASMGSHPLRRMHPPGGLSEHRMKSGWWHDIPWLKHGWWHYVPHCLLAVAALLLFHRLRLVLAPFIIAYLLAAALDPLVVQMEGRGWRRGRAVLCIYAVFLLLFLISLFTLLPVAVAQVGEFAREVPVYIEKAPRLFEDARQRLGAVEIPQYLRDAITRHVGSIATTVAKRVAAWAQGIIGSFGFLLWLVLIPVATFFLLNDIQRVRANLLRLVPEQQRSVAQAIAADVADVFIRYLRGLAIVAVLYGLFLLVTLLFLGIPYAVALGVMAGVLYPVPYLGPFVTTATILVVGAVTEGWGVALAAVGLSLFWNQVFDLWLFPRIAGRSVELHPVVCMMALLVGADLFGLPGMLFAYPAAGAVRIIGLRLLSHLRSQPPAASGDLERGEPEPSRAVGKRME